jgi:hypothetical protein
MVNLLKIRIKGRNSLASKSSKMLHGLRLSINPIKVSLVVTDKHIRVTTNHRRPQTRPRTGDLCGDGSHFVYLVQLLSESSNPESLRGHVNKRCTNDIRSASRKMHCEQMVHLEI